MHEVIIVGGGPIGTITSILLTRKNIDVLLIEKQKHPRWKPCGEGISKEGQEILKQQHLISCVKHLLHKITSLSFNIGNQNIFFKEYNHPISFTFDRTDFDYSLIKYAKDTGVEVHESECVKDVIEKKNIQITTKNHRYNTNILIGADGVFSIVGKKIFRKWRYDEIGLSEVAKYHFKKIPKTVKANTMEYYFVEGGYGWIFPRENNGELTLNIGIASKDNHKIQQIFHCFISLLEKNKKIKLHGKETDKIWRHPIPSHGICRGIFEDKTLLIGDAGGFVHPLTGGGLKFGIQSAIYAAETVTEYLNGNISSLKIYQDKVENNILPNFSKAITIRNKVYFIKPNELISLLHNNQDFVEKILQSFMSKTNYNL